MKVAIVGSREFRDMNVVVSYVLSLSGGTVVVSGGARGVDRTAESAARGRGLDVVSFRPTEFSVVGYVITRHLFRPGEEAQVEELPGYYRSFPPAAFARNGFIVSEADIVQAFWDGDSSGTRNSIAQAALQGKPCEVTQ